MPSYSSGSIHFDGLGNGTNFSEMIDKLYTLESKYANKLLKWKADWKQRTEAFGQVRTELLSLRNFLATMDTPEKFLVKSINSSKQEVATATAVAGSETLQGTYNLSVKQLATNCVWSLETGFADKNAVVNSGTTDAFFNYTYKGTSVSVKVPPQTTLSGLQKLINNDANNAGVNVSLVQSTTGVVFQIRGKDFGSEADLTVDSTTGMDAVFTKQTGPRWETISPTNMRLGTKFASLSAVVNSTGADQTFVIEKDGAPVSYTIPAGATVEDVFYIIENQKAQTGISAALSYSEGSTIQLSLSVASGSLAMNTATDGTLPSMNAEDTITNWQVQENQNAMIRINGWPSPPQWLQQESNTITGVVEGLNINLRSTGDTTITVGIDTAAIEKNVEQFVEMTNKFRKLLLDMTKVDDNKTVLDPKYAESQFEMQKGSVLTGNYGVQLLSSRLKQAIGGQAPGFMYAERDATGKLVGGDLFSSLAQIGILTNATEGDANFGLLQINTINWVPGSLKGSYSLKQALEMDPVGVAELFSAKSQGRCDSAETSFGYLSHVQSVTKAGTYDVQYSVDGSGNVTGTINGKAAKYDPATHQLGLLSTGGENPANGIFLEVYDLTPNSTHTGTVSIRDGIANSLLGMMDGPEGLLSKEKGPLTILENNYKEIMKNIDAKILKEDERLDKWERTTRLRFSRLEAVLSKYNSLNEGLKSQLKQLSSGDS